MSLTWSERFCCQSASLSATVSLASGQAPEDEDTKVLGWPPRFIRAFATFLWYYNKQVDVSKLVNFLTEKLFSLFLVYFSYMPFSLFTVIYHQKKSLWRIFWYIERQSIVTLLLLLANQSPMRWRSKSKKAPLLILTMWILKHEQMPGKNISPFFF